jgi:uncharacterized protein YijF (DUF1287 family)
MKRMKLKPVILFLILLILLIPTGYFLAAKDHIFTRQIQLQFQNVVEDLEIKISPERAAAPSPVEEKPVEELTTADLILLGARREALNKTRYDATYAVINYPGGDVSSDRGACTDVVIRAFRHAGIDLQQLIHEDMLENFSLYPQNWGLNAPDPNIDHRRVPNQICFLERHALPLTLEVEGHLEEWQWGDIVYWRFQDGRDHCGIISDRIKSNGIPLVIHNAGLAREENYLQRWEITGHFRYTG